MNVNPNWIHSARHPCKIDSWQALRSRSRRHPVVRNSCSALYSSPILVISSSIRSFRWGLWIPIRSSLSQYFISLALACRTFGQGFLNRRSANSKVLSLFPSFQGQEAVTPVYVSLCVSLWAELHRRYQFCKYWKARFGRGDLCVLEVSYVIHNSTDIFTTRGFS